MADNTEKMSKQTEIIGNHPDEEHPIGAWLFANDLPHSDTKCHRELTVREHIEGNDEITNWMASKLIEHHYTKFRLDRLKQKYKELGFEKYAEQHRKLPISDRVKKGNATEILLTEYLESALGRNLIKVFKLKYNPNVDQAIKGDDTLMVDVIENNGRNDIKIYLGESKFRSTPSKKAVEDISDSLTNDKMPLSYSFLVEEIAKTNEELALKLDDFIVQDVKNRGNLAYTGLLLSNENTSRFVENNLDNDNDSLVFISIGIENPADLINLAFEKANDLVSTPEQL